MDVSAHAERRRAGRSFLPPLVGLTVFGVVAIASAGHRPASRGASRGPNARLLDLVLSFGAVVLAVVMIGSLLLYIYARRVTRGGNATARRTPAGALALFSGCVLLVVVVVRLHHVLHLDGLASLQPGRAHGEGQTSVSPGGYHPHFATVPVLIVLGAATALLAALLLSRRAHSGAVRDDENGSAPSLDAVLADTLGDLRAEPDPRRAVIAAYAHLELTLASAGHERHRSEAPGEYLARVLREADVSSGAVSRLTRLFARAKFSEHVIDESMREEAIEALEAVREELRTRENVDSASIPT